MSPSGERLVANAPRRIPNPKPRPSPFPDRNGSVAIAGDGDAEETDWTGQRLRVGVAALVALVLAALLGYFVTSRPGGLFGSPTSVALPNLVGSDSADAEGQLDKLGVRYNVVPVPSENVPADRVVRQDPARGEAVAARGVVQLFVSTGLPTVQLIDVRQYSSDDAQRYLRNAKLVPKIVERFAPSARGTVLSQKPMPGSTVPIHAQVVLVVSKGAQPVAVPDIVSQTLADATSELAARHLSLVVSERDPNDEIPADTIVSQNPQPGSDVAPNSAVDVVVSSGAPTLDIPGVEGRIAGDAVGVLQNAGLQPQLEYLVDASVPLGTVLKQNPESGTPAKKGSSVTLDVAVPGVVPDVAGRSAADAQAMLQNAGYKIGNTSYVQEGPDGTVARTEPVSGSALRPGETVMRYLNGVSKEGQ